MFATFNDVRKFFESWGLFPSEEKLPDCISPEVHNVGVSSRVYEKIREEAGKHIQSSKHPDYFQKFVSRSIDATDGCFYLAADTWVELEEAWDDYVSSLKLEVETSPRE